MKYSFSNFLGIIWRIWLVSNVLVHWIRWDMDTCPKLDICPYLYVSSATDDALDTISTLIWKHNSNSSPLSFLFFFLGGWDYLVVFLLVSACHPPLVHGFLGDSVMMRKISCWETVLPAVAGQLGDDKESWGTKGLNFLWSVSIRIIFVRSRGQDLMKAIYCSNTVLEREIYASVQVGYCCWLIMKAVITVLFDFTDDESWKSHNLQYPVDSLKVQSWYRINLITIGERSGKFFLGWNLILGKV